MHYIKFLYYIKYISKGIFVKSSVKSYITTIKKITFSISFNPQIRKAAAYKMTRYKINNQSFTK